MLHAFRFLSSSSSVMYKKRAIIASILAAIWLLGYGILQLSKSRTFQFFGWLMDHVTTDQKIVALTFDDAPSAYSDEVLQILKEKNIKATFFVIGKAMEAYPQEVKRIAKAWQELGNHSYSHQRFLLKSRSFTKHEIEKTDQLIRESGYTGEITFRPPNGKKFITLPRYLHNSKRQTIMRNIEPDSYVAGNAEKIAEYTINALQPWSIILMHPFCKTECTADRQALPKIIDAAQAMGYSFITIDQMLTYK